MSSYRFIPEPRQAFCNGVHYIKHPDKRVIVTMKSKNHRQRKIKIHALTAVSQ